MSERKIGAHKARRRRRQHASQGKAMQGVEEQGDKDKEQGKDV